MKYLIQTKESIFGKTAAKAARNSDKTFIMCRKPHLKNTTAWNLQHLFMLVSMRSLTEDSVVA